MVGTVRVVESVGTVGTVDAVRVVYFLGTVVSV
jgi:hypothetical protein